MERSWWWKFALYGAAVVLAVLYLTPTAVSIYAPEVELPAFFKHFNKRIQLGLDLKGGLHLVYEVNIEKAVSGKVDRLADEVEDALKKKGAAVTVTRSGRDDIAITFKVPAEMAKLDDELLKPYRRDLDEAGRDPASGTVKLKYDADRVAEVEDLALRQAIETIRGRVDKFGVAEPTIIKKGTDIVVELPGAKQEEFERIKNIIGRTAQLEFKIVDDGSDYMKKVAAAVPKDSVITVAPEAWTEKQSGAQHEDIYLRVKEKDREELTKFIAGLTGDLAVPNDREIGIELMSSREVEDGEGTPDRWYRSYFLKKRAGVTGEYLADASESWDDMNRPEVAFTMNRQGAGMMEKLTGENVGRKMAVILDEKITSAPVIESKIGERGRITMGGGGDPFKLQQEVKDLVGVLRSGALPAPLKKSFETQVGATMGQDAIEKAKFSMAIGALAVILFMLIYYRISGFIANLAMTLNMLFMMAILAGFEASLTLPGIAGLVLTIGMAVDSNIIIYERIREELRLGKSPRTAVDAGFQRAFWTVFDAHVTNFVAGIVLYSYGSGPIRGFAVTLLIGIVTNLLTSVWISHWMFAVLVSRRGVVRTTLSI
jgi:preprotein translocase subunit SecD